ncbi:hypothetical protein VPH35_112649 [Triticum aestivum]|uniref:uncharacterized protein n=1 Tax=Triticum aestivum TaxID=4565 RepID=UPI0008451B3F|nr:uncharacterized protein LOC123138483 [Triticum aestivum]
MAPYLLRSAVAILRRSTPQVSDVLRRSSPRSFSGGALRVEATKGCCMDKDMEKLAADLREVNAQLDFLLEQERRFERGQELQKKLSCVLVPATIAFYIFGPKKKGKPSEEEQPDI